MSEFTRIQKRVLRQYTKPIVHMRHRLRRKKLSLVFGAGIGESFGIPRWDELLERMAKDPAVKGSGLLRRNKNRSHGPKTQILFHRFASKLQAHDKNLTLGQIKNRWRQIVREHLYEGANKNIGALVDDHDYIEPYIRIVQESPMTINYNFDDYIEKILHTKAPVGPSTEYARSFETVWDPQLQTKLDKCVIYHPNGFLPEEKMERPSGGLVFCEDEFADQLIETMAGRYASLLHHYSQHTCLFVGLSLQDSTLKHLLRQSATLNPGHYHYYVDYYPKGSNKPEKSEREAVYEANFNLYNLITLSLTKDELRTLGNLIVMDDNEFHTNAADAGINLLFCYYIVGAMGVGKSSVISYFRNLATHDEWPDFRLRELGRRPKKLSSKEEKKVDDWINRQFKKKNDILARATAGLHIVDRAPLDPIAFKPPSGRSRRAASLMANICDTSDPTKIRAGHIVLLQGEPQVLEERVRAGGKEHTARDLEEMQTTLRRIYYSRKGMSLVDTRRKSKEEVVKEVARILHSPVYGEKDLHSRLVAIAKGRVKC